MTRKQLVAYTRGVPGETARFTRDEAFLQQVGETTAERVAVLEALKQTLRELAAP